MQLRREQPVIASLLLVAIGGAFGSVARYLLTTRVQRYTRRPFPLGTLVVNLSGCLLIGLLFGAIDSNAQEMALLTFLVAGVLGGYTTFSTFSIENLHLLQRGDLRGLLLNIVVQVVGGLLLAGVGYWLIAGTS